MYGNSNQRFTPAVTNLIIINTLVFIAQITVGGPEMFDALQRFGLHPIDSPDFRPHQVITHMFMHGGFMHLLFNMYALWMFGTIIEKVWGPKRFLIYYVVCGIGAAALHLLVQKLQAGNAAVEQDPVAMLRAVYNNDVAVGASGAIMGVLVAFGYLFPNTQMIIIPFPFPVKAKWVVLAFIAIDLFSGISQRAGDNIAHFAHLGGAITGFLIVVFQNKKNRNTFY